jgi:hypothetical protein
MGNMRNSYEILIGKPEGKRPLGRPRHRWEDNQRMDLGEIEWESMDGSLALDRGHWWCCCEHGYDLSCSIKGREFPD